MGVLPVEGLACPGSAIGASRNTGSGSCRRFNNVLQNYGNVCLKIVKLRLACGGQPVRFSGAAAFELPGACDVCFPFQHRQKWIDCRRPKIGFVVFSDLEYDLVSVHLPSGEELQNDRLEKGFNGLCCLLAEALSPCNRWASARCVLSALVSVLSLYASEVVSRHISHEGCWDINSCPFSAPAVCQFSIHSYSATPTASFRRLPQRREFEHHEQRENRQITG